MFSTGSTVSSVGPYPFHLTWRFRSRSLFTRRSILFKLYPFPTAFVESPALVFVLKPNAPWKCPLLLSIKFPVAVRQTLSIQQILDNLLVLVVPLIYVFLGCDSLAYGRVPVYKACDTKFFGPFGSSVVDLLRFCWIWSACGKLFV